MPLPPKAWRRMLSAAIVQRGASRGVARQRRDGRRLAIEPLESRQLLAVFAPVGSADFSGHVAIDALYSFASQPAEIEQATQDFQGLSPPNSGSVQIDPSRLENCYSDGASGFIERLDAGPTAQFAIEGYASVVHGADPMEGTIISRASSVSYSVEASDPIVVRIDPSLGQQVGDLVGLTIGVTADGRIYGIDQYTAPEGNAAAQGNYSYDYRIIGPGGQVLGSGSGSGALPERLGVQPLLEDVRSGPINVPIGSQVEIRMHIDGSVSTSDLGATSQTQARMTMSLGFAQTDILAESLAWEVAGSTDQASRFLDFSYYVDASQTGLNANAEVEFYWAAGTTLSSVLGSLESPAARWSIDQPGEKTPGAHSASIPLSQLADPPLGASHLLMVIDRANVVAESSKANNLLAVAALPEVEMGELIWNTRRDQDPYGGWRGVDVQYDVSAGGPAALGEIAFYWATGTTFDTHIGGPLTPRTTQTTLGLHQFNEPALWGAKPDAAKYVLAVFDPAGQIVEWNEQNNVAALAVHSADEILVGSLDLDPQGTLFKSPTSLTVWFKPGGGSPGQAGRFTISEAEVAFGVHHFNWYQQIQNVPAHWRLYEDETAGGSPATAVPIPLPWLDPSNRVPDQSYLLLESTMAGSVERFAANPNDDRIYYYNEPWFDYSQQVNVAGVTRSSSMVFTDAPRVPAEYLAAGEAWQFVTSLEGVDADGRPVTLPLVGQRTFTWKANTVYDRNDPSHPITGGAIFLQALDESQLPPAIAGGVFDVAFLNSPAPVAVPDAASTVVDTPLVIRVTANDYDPEGDVLRIYSAGGASHGSVAVHDAGTPDDPTDDYVLYTPDAGFVGQDVFHYTITRSGAPGYAFGQATITVLPALKGLGTIGDSLSDEYAGQGFDYAQSWTELLASAENVNFGANGSWSEPRRSGYEYNWSRAGATTQAALAAGAHTSLAGQMADNLVSHAVVAIGQDDFLPGRSAYVGIYMQGLPVLGGWTTEQIDAYTDTVVANIRTALGTVNDGGKVVLANLIDFGAAPLAVGQYSDPARRQLVTDVIADVNSRIAALAAEYRVPLADLAGVSAALFGTGASPVAAQTIGGTLFMNSSGEEPLNMFVADGLHPHTIVQAAYANVILESFAAGYGEKLNPMTEQEMVERAGATYGGQDTLNLDWDAYVVLPANALPVGQADYYAVHQGSTLSVDAVASILANDSDADMDPLRATVVDGGPRHGTLILSANGAFTYVPAAGYVGPDQFSYVAGDGYGQSQPITVQIDVLPPAAILPDTPGLFDPDASACYVRYSNTTGPADAATAFGIPGAGWLPISGDWNGDGSASLGLYDPQTSVFYLTNSVNGGFADLVVPFGMPGAGWIPLAGDWNGDRVTTVGLYDPATSLFYLTDSTGGGVAERTVAYGAAGLGWVPVIGDWDGDHVDTIGLYDPSTSMFYLRNSNTTGMATLMFGFGMAGAGMTPLVGDWDADGTDTIGVFDPALSLYYLRNDNSTGFAAVQFGFGQPGSGWIPLAAKWEGAPQPTYSPATLDAAAVDQIDLASLAATEEDG